MSIYLIDTENVQTRFTQLIPELNQNDSIILFMIKGRHCISLHIDDIVAINKKNIGMSIIDCFNGKAKKNALDFQLVSYLGYMISKQDRLQYVIVSNDNGFDPVVEFWKDHLNIDIERIAISTISPTSRWPSPRPTPRLPATIL